MVYIRGGTHGNFSDTLLFCEKFGLTEKDTVVILGDAGLNFWISKRDKRTKRQLSGKKPTFFCIHGNHEKRPQNIDTYVTKEWNGGTVWYEPEYPNILFAKDGEIYNLDGKSCLVLGGAYSVDKYYRLYNFLLKTNVSDDVLLHLAKIVNPYSEESDTSMFDKMLMNLPNDELHWWSDEQITDDMKKKIENHIADIGKKVDVIFSHTCPKKYIPHEALLKGLNQATVDGSMEEWLDKIEETIKYDAWYCGHWHIDKRIDKMHFLFNSVKSL